jgi:cysteinyl-tRNA synthetase
MLMTQYRQPIDWTVDRLVEARRTLSEWIDAVEGFEAESGALPSELLDALSDDLNLPGAVGVLHGLYRAAKHRTDAIAGRRFGSALAFLGLWGGEMSNDVFGYGVEVGEWPAPADIDALIADRNLARKEKNFREADRIRDELAAMGVVLKDSKDGTTWEIAR